MTQYSGSILSNPPFKSEGEAPVLVSASDTPKNEAIFYPKARQEAIQQRPAWQDAHVWFLPLAYKSMRPCLLHQSQRDCMYVEVERRNRVRENNPREKDVKASSRD
jgi:hypothetical protein